MRHVGGTGTRLGCTPGQHMAVRLTLEENWERGASFHHGGCVGVDWEMHVLAWMLNYRIVVHPPSNLKLRAWVEHSEFWSPRDVVLPEKPYLDRNWDIADAVNGLIVVPSGPEKDSPRSGTWACYRQAVGLGKTTIIIPSGGIT